MKRKLTIKGELPSLNEYIAANNKNRYIANRMKQDATTLVEWQLGLMKEIRVPANYHFHWVVKNKRKDPDNIAFAVKFIFDAMQIVGALKNDSMAWIKSIHHTYSVGEPEIRITIDSED